MLHPDAVASIAVLFNVPVGFKVVAGSEHTVMLPDGAVDQVQEAKRLLRRELRRQGMTNLERLEHLSGVPAAALMVLVDREPSLHRRDRVVWRSPEPSSHLLPRTLDRMLVAGPLKLAELREGLEVAWRYHHHARPPS